MKKTFNVQEIIPKRTRKRVPMYTGEWTLNSIWIHISGYLHACSDSNILESEDITFSFSYFHQYVRDKLNFYSPSVGWKDIIIAHTLSYSEKDVPWEDVHKREKQMTYEEHVHSTDVFFQLLDEFYALSLKEFYTIKMSRILPNFFENIEKETFSIGFNRSSCDISPKYTIALLEKYKNSYILFYDFSSFEKIDFNKKDNYHKFSSPHEVLHFINSIHWTELEEIVKMNKKIEQFNHKLAF